MPKIKIGEYRKKLPLRWPFKKAVDNFRSQCLSRSDYDPAATFVWGQLMAIALLKVIEGVEERFGAEGQQVCREAVNKVGYDVWKEMANDVEIPDGSSGAELLSLMWSWINEVLYASIEEYFVDKDSEKGGCVIHYCPHQDIYQKFDCRVQRFFVEGMGKAAEEIWPSNGLWDSYFRYSIPQGNKTCLFEFERRKTGNTGNPWSEYTDELLNKALRQQKKEGNQTDKK